MRQTVKKWMEEIKNYNDSEIEKELNRLGDDLVLLIGQALMGKETIDTRPITPPTPTQETNETVNGPRTSYARGERQFSSNYIEEESESEDET